MSAEMHDFADAVPSDLRAVLGRLADRYGDMAAPEPTLELTPLMTTDAAISCGPTQLPARTGRAQRAKRVVAATAATTLGKVVLGTSLAAAAVGAGQATGIIHVTPHIGGSPSAPRHPTTNTARAERTGSRRVEPNEPTDPTASVGGAPHAHTNVPSIPEPTSAGSASEADATAGPDDTADDTTTVVTSGEDTNSPQDNTPSDDPSDNSPPDDPTG